MPAQTMAEWSTEEGEWVLLGCIPDVALDVDLPPGADLSIQREHLPHPSRLTVSRRVAPDPKDIYNHPYVSAMGDSGRFVLYATHGTQPEGLFVDDFDTGPEARLDHEDFPKVLFLCDLNTRKATRLPHPELPFVVLDPGSVGLIDVTSSDSIIMYLQPLVGTNQVTLLWYSSSSADHRWTVQNIYYPPGEPKWKGGDGVIKYMDLMLWVDLSCGILTLDTTLLLQRQPELRYVPFPKDCQKPGAYGQARERCVCVSAGRVRFLEISNSYTRIRLWTLVDPGTGDWTLDHQLEIKHLWDDNGFKDMRLPNDWPAVAFIHPEHATMAYFFQESLLFSVDMRTGKVMDARDFMTDNPPADYYSSRFVRPWKLARPLSPGMLN